MKVLHINTFPYKAPGSLMMSIHRRLLSDGHESFAAWGRGRKGNNDHEISFLDPIGVALHGVYTRITDKTGFLSYRATSRLIKQIDKIHPDIIHLHNIHGYYLNVEMLFRYMKAHGMKVVWTLHDCWSFTGHCAYFDAVGCDKWKTGCNNCPQRNTYPASNFLDNSAWNWKKKKSLFCGLDVNIVTPSAWLAELVNQSFLGEYPVHVIHNGIDTNLFHYRESDFKHRVCSGKRILLGVASEWTPRKGLQDFLRLHEELNEDDNIQIVLVGLTQKQIEELPDGIIGIPRTSSAEELAQIYSAADWFFNPTYEDNFPTTNLEALACGTPVMTYKTGGSPECIKAAECGTVVSQGDVERALLVIRNNELRRREDTLLDDDFHSRAMIDQYVALYNSMLEK